MGKSAIAAIDTWLSKRGQYTEDNPLFSAIHKSYWGNRLHSHSVYKLVQKYAKIAGIDKIMSPHRIRHSSITEALNITNDDNRVSLQGEHKDILDDL